MGQLFQLLEKKTGSTQGAYEAISEVATRLGASNLGAMDESLAGLALCVRGERIETVSKHLTWRDFERFCSNVLRAKGFRVRENIYLRKPRAQIDVLGTSDRFSLAIDCKHWARTSGEGTLAKLVETQKGRARRLHDSLDFVSPIVPVIVVLTDGGARLLSGGAVVPIFAVGDFLDSVDSLTESLDFV